MITPLWSSTCTPAGVCLYIMLAGCLPFDERSVGALLRKIASAEYEMPPWISQHAAALLRAILQPNPAKRWGPCRPASGVLQPVLTPGVGPFSPRRWQGNGRFGGRCYRSSRPAGQANM
jgi:serine/threonine protein kinase